MGLGERIPGSFHVGKQLIPIHWVHCGSTSIETYWETWLPWMK